MSTVQSLWEIESNSVTDVMFSNPIEIDIGLYKNSPECQHCICGYFDDIKFLVNKKERDSCTWRLLFKTQVKSIHLHNTVLGELSWFSREHSPYLLQKCLTGVTLCIVNFYILSSLIGESLVFATVYQKCFK